MDSIDNVGSIAVRSWGKKCTINATVTCRFKGLERKSTKCFTFTCEIISFCSLLQLLLTRNPLNQVGNETGKCVHHLDMFIQHCLFLVVSYTGHLCNKKCRIFSSLHVEHQNSSFTPLIIAVLLFTATFHIVLLINTIKLLVRLLPLMRMKFIMEKNKPLLVAEWIYW